MIKFFRSILILTLSILIFSCDTGKKETTQNPESNSNLSPFEIENGIGPVKSKIELGEIDNRLVALGERLYEQKCTICHKLDDEYMGPPQGNVLIRRTPEFVMNMLLNPDEMQEKHPAFKESKFRYSMRMPNQNLSYDDARAILEYLRLVNQK